MKKITIIIFVLFISTLKTFAQHSKTNSNPYIKIIEAEFYPINAFDLRDKTLKYELTGNAYRFHEHNKFVEDFYAFHDMNVHWKKNELVGLISYGQYSFGLKNKIQAAIELGSTNGHEYAGFGLNFMIHDKWAFERMALIARSDLTCSNFIYGYEYFTKELEIGRLVVNSTGVGRVILPSRQILFQGSVWLSTRKFHNTLFGFEFEHNSVRNEHPNEGYLGIKRIF